VGIVIRTTLDVAGLLAAVRPTLARLAAEAAPRPAAAPEPSGTAPVDCGASEAQALAVDARRAAVLRRALEEWGVHCREHAGLAALDAFGVISARGVEVGVAADLPPAERALAYARGVARLLMHDDRQFATWFDYRPGCSPQHLTPLERRTAAVVESLARALLKGRLEAAPRYLIPTASADPTTTASGLLGDCSRALLVSLHRASSALYWRSDSYQALRASPPMVHLTSRVHALLSATSGRRAA
jgi:hypothetical protein